MWTMWKMRWGSAGNTRQNLLKARHLYNTHTSYNGESFGIIASSSFTETIQVARRQEWCQSPPFQRHQETKCIYVMWAKPQWVAETNEVHETGIRQGPQASRSVAVSLHCWHWQFMQITLNFQHVALQASTCESLHDMRCARTKNHHMSQF